MIRTLIVDDEPLARRGIRLRLQDEADLEVIGEAADGPEAVRMIAALQPDLVFLDVQMPGLNGFEVLARVADVHLPAVIFVTAYDEYAIRAFDVRAIDYLLKPYTKERFDEALRRARRELREGDEEAPSRIASLFDDGNRLTRITVRHRDRFLIVKTADVDWLAAAGNYVEVHAGEKAYLVRSTIANLDARLDPRTFVRIHRSTIVNVERIAEIRSDAHGDYDVTLHGGKVLRMTRNYSERVLGRV
ncbi:MAG TPA: response regulator [Thermoanaerobaculia bacterium]